VGDGITGGGGLAEKLLIVLEPLKSVKYFYMLSKRGKAVHHGQGGVNIKLREKRCL